MHISACQEICVVTTLQKYELQLWEGKRLGRIDNLSGRVAWEDGVGMGMKSTCLCRVELIFEGLHLPSKKIEYTNVYHR